MPSVGSCSKKGHFARLCKSKKKPKDSQHSQQSSAKYVQQEEKEESFQLRADKSNTLNHATIQARINGVKGKMEADSRSTANIMDEHKFNKLQSALEEKIPLQPTNTQLYAFAQKEPVPLIGCFDKAIEGVSTGKKTMTRFLVAEGIT